MPRLRFLGLAAGLLAIVTVPGWAGGKQKPGSGKAEYLDFTGRLEAVETVQLRSRVTGTIENVHFREGAIVQAGELLFELDSRVFQAELQKAEADMLRARAAVQLADAEAERMQQLKKSQAVGPDELTRAKAGRDRARADVMVAEAGLQRAKLNLIATRIQAPINGVIGRALVGRGNLVRATDTGSLATIVSLDPIRVAFSASQRNWEMLQWAADVHGGAALAAAKLPVHVVVGEGARPLEAVLDFCDNHFDPRTGTILLRATLANPDGRLLPGMFARVRVPLGPPK